LVFGHSMEAANLPTFLQFGNTKKSDFVLSLQKKSWVATKLGGGLEQNWGDLCPPGPGLKPPLYIQRVYSIYNQR